MSKSTFLTSLHIANLAVIPCANIELLQKLNCFTGSTGSGKSLIISSLELLLGMRPAQNLLRQGAPEGRVSGLFEVTSPTLRQSIQSLTDILLDGTQVLLTRRLFPSNRSAISLNGHPITLAMLQSLAPLLIDIHGQHDQQYLTKPANQIHLLDAFAGLTQLKESYSRAYAEWSSAKKRLADLQQGESSRGHELELYRFQAAELDAASLEPGELESLAARASKLSNVDRIEREAGQSFQLLTESDDNLEARVGSISRTLSALADLDPALSNIATTLQSAAIAVEDASRSLQRYLSKLESDPAQLAEVNERLTLIHHLARKYAGRAPSVIEGYQDELAQVLAYRSQLARQLGELEAQTLDLSSLSASLAPLEAKARKLAAQLSASRRSAVSRLAHDVEQAMKDLLLNRAAFQIDIQGTSESPLTSTGLDTVEFMAAINPGIPAAPLRHVASGGELSRVMLALKGVLAASNPGPVMIFDEIDSNVGGRLGSVIAAKLRDISHSNQVICITHLPQIAAYADRHFTVQKSQTANQTVTTVSEVAGDAQVAELAEMISGTQVSPTTLKQARELLSSARLSPIPQPPFAPIPVPARASSRAPSAPAVLPDSDFADSDLPGSDLTASGPQAAGSLGRRRGATAPDRPRHLARARQRDN